MRKSVVTPVWLWGLVAIVVGLIGVGLGTGLIFAAGGTWINYGWPAGSEFTPTLDGFFWSMVTLASLGGLVLLGGVVAQLVALVGALINTYALPDKAWFVILLVGGVLGAVGVLVAPFAVMVAYLIAGPDAPQAGVAPTRGAAAPPPATLMPSS